MGANYGQGRDAWRDRAARAMELRTSCVDCGGDVPLPAPNQPPPRCSCGGRSHTLDEIAAELSCSRTSVSDYVRDPNRELARARRRRYTGTCHDCGGPTSDRQTTECRWCRNGEPSPHLLETSPTGFRHLDVRRRTCGHKGCENPLPEPTLEPGKLMCSECEPLFARLRAEFAAEERRHEGGGVNHANAFHDPDELAVAA